LSNKNSEALENFSEKLEVEGRSLWPWGLACSSCHSPFLWGQRAKHRQELTSLWSL